jgi:hypothetical protein
VGAAVALRQAWLRNSLAAAGPGTMTDGGDNRPLRDIVAQGLTPPPRPPGAGSLVPGLYVHVIDGMIVMSNAGGTLNFSAGQFGYTPSLHVTPILLPTNPGLKFTPPPVFSSMSSPASGSRPGVVNCEVR